MREWFESRQPRERIVLAGGAVAALLMALFLFVWRPLSTGTEELRDSVADKEQLLAELYRAAAVGPATGSTGAQGSSLVVLVDRTAQTSGLGNSLTRARPDGPNGINVSFQNASFDELTSWLVTLAQSEGVFVDGASINSTRDSGLVSGQVLLRRN